MRLQAIVFDYDGVLANTEPLHLRAFQQTLAPLGIDLPLHEYFELYLGLDDEAVFRTVGERHGMGWGPQRLGALAADKAERFRRSVTVSFLPAGVEGREPILYPGVTERLRAWSREVPLAIASGSLRVEIEPVLAAEGLLEAVPIIVAAGDTPNGKPSADPYLRALQLLSGRRDRRLGPLEPSRCVAVEDSAWGIDAALAAGMTVIALTTSYPPDRLGAAHRVVGGFGDLDLEMMSSAIPPAPIRRNGSSSPSL